jgi:hypothetical protein
MKKKSFLMGAAFIMIAALVLSGCSKKESGSAAASKSSVKANPASDFSYDLTADGKGILIKGYNGGPGAVVVPATIEDIPVTEIGEKVFNGKSMTINLSAGNAVDAVGSKGNENAGITAITIPNTVTKIGGSAFANTAITKFDMPDSVTELGASTFEGCGALTEVRLSDNITKIPAMLFGGALSGGVSMSLTKVNLPKSLKEIKYMAFYGLSDLTELIIPSEITSVQFLDWFDDDVEPDNMAFSGCGKLPIKIRQTIQGWGYTSTF